MSEVRKIMVEVTPQEYQKIVSGCFEKNLDNFSTLALVEELEKRARNQKKCETETKRGEFSDTVFKTISGDVKEKHIDFSFLIKIASSV